jgi:hypothetical protein
VIDDPESEDHLVGLGGGSQTQVATHTAEVLHQAKAGHDAEEAFQPRVGPAFTSHIREVGPGVGEVPGPTSNNHNHSSRG